MKISYNYRKRRDGTWNGSVDYSNSEKEFFKHIESQYKSHGISIVEKEWEVFWRYDEI